MELTSHSLYFREFEYNTFEYKYLIYSAPSDSDSNLICICLGISDNSGAFPLMANVHVEKGAIDNAKDVDIFSLSVGSALYSQVYHNHSNINMITFMALNIIRKIRGITIRHERG